MIAERAYAKVNLVLHSGPPREDGLHPLCSLFASLELADDLTIERGERDELECEGVTGENLATQALEAIREAAPALVPPLRIRIDKRIPVTAGLGGGSADAAAVLRAGNEVAGRPLDAGDLRALAAKLGADIPSQVEPWHALVTGVGEQVERLDLPDAVVVLAPASHGLHTSEVYAELDRLGGWRQRLDPERLRDLAARPLAEVAREVENDLEQAALSLRPELGQTLATLRESGALAAAVTGSGPTAFGLFAAEPEAETAAARLPEAIVTRTRRAP